MTIDMYNQGFWYNLIVLITRVATLTSGNTCSESSFFKKKKKGKNDSLRVVLHEVQELANLLLENKNAS